MGGSQPVHPYRWTDVTGHHPPKLFGKRPVNRVFNPTTRLRTMSP